MKRLDELVADTWAITALVEGEYLLGTPSGCVLVSQGMNDVYRIDLPGEPYVLRIHGAAKWWLKQQPDFRFELDLLVHRHRQGVPVSYPRKGSAIGWSCFPSWAKPPGSKKAR